MNPIKKIQINRLSPINYEVEVHTEALMNEQVIIVKADFNYFFSKKANNQLHKAQISLNPAINVEPNIRIYLYNYLTDHVEEIRHEFIEMNPFLFPQVLDATYMMGGSDFFNRNWNRGLKALKIEGPFQNDAKVKKINPSQKVTFHASTNAQNTDIAQIMSIQWHLIDENKQEINIRKLKDFKIVANKERVTVSFYLNEMSSFTLHAHYSNFKEAILLFSNQNPESQNQKTKIHFTIGMFFDGTGNNKLNSDQVYYKNLDNKNLVKDSTRQKQLMLSGKKNTKFKVATDSSYWNPYSNVALLHDLYKTEIVKKDDFNTNVTLKQYVQGIGTEEGENDDFLGTAFGEGINGIIGKVIEGCMKIAAQMAGVMNTDSEIGSITFDVFGFSRGAAAARHFCNEILGKESTDDIFEKIPNESKEEPITKLDNLAVKKDTQKFKPIGVEYNFGMLGSALKKLEIQHTVKQFYTFEVVDAKNAAEVKKAVENQKQDFAKKAPVKIRFVGLYDTVVSQMIVKNKVGEKIDKANVVNPFPIKLPPFVGSIIEMQLDRVKQKIDQLPIQQIVHLIAQDEYRENFALTKVGSSKNIFEIELPGAHSDLGGGYAAFAQEKDILDYDYVNHQTTEIPIPERLQVLKKLYVANGYAQPEEIEIKKIKTINYTTENAIAYRTLFQLIATRKIIPRYSIVNLNVMKALAKERNVGFSDSTTENSYKFEYILPKGLIHYEKNLIDNLKAALEGKPKKGNKNELQKFKFIHLSSNYNEAKLIKNKGEAIIGFEELDRVFYINAPLYKNEKRENYEREVYDHPQ